MATVGDIIDEIKKMRLRQAVVAELVTFLSQFVATDTFEPTKGIASPYMDGVVPQDVIDAVRCELLAEQEKLEDCILKVQSKPVDTPTRKKTSSKKIPAKKISARKITKRPPKRRRYDDKAKQESA